MYFRLSRLSHCQRVSSFASMSRRRDLLAAFPSGGIGCFEPCERLTKLVFVNQVAALDVAEEFFGSQLALEDPFALRAGHNLRIDEPICQLLGAFERCRVGLLDRIDGLCELVFFDQPACSTSSISFSAVIAMPIMAPSGALGTDACYFPA